jgi:hypothetical protein
MVLHPFIGKPSFFIGPDFATVRLYQSLSDWSENFVLTPRTISERWFRAFSKISLRFCFYKEIRKGYRQNRCPGSQNP